MRRRKKIPDLFGSTYVSAGADWQYPGPKHLRSSGFTTVSSTARRAEIRRLYSRLSSPKFAIGHYCVFFLCACSSWPGLTGCFMYGSFRIPFFHPSQTHHLTSPSSPMITVCPTTVSTSRHDLGRTRFLASGISGLVIFAVTIPALIWADSWGRRSRVILGGLGLTILMFYVDRFDLHRRRRIPFYRCGPLGRHRLDLPVCSHLQYLRGSQLQSVCG